MIYLDHNATTPVLPEVFEAMREAAHQSIRFSLGAENTDSEIREAVAAVKRCVSTLGGVR